MGGQLIGLNQNGWPFSSAASERSALTGADLSELGLHCCQDQSATVKASLWWKYTHKTQVDTVHWYSLAHSECCCLAGLCSEPGVASSLSLGCRWCTSSLGYPFFCWRETSLLYLRPRGGERNTLKTDTDITCPNDLICLLYFNRNFPLNYIYLTAANGYFQIKISHSAAFFLSLLYSVFTFSPPVILLHLPFNFIPSFVHLILWTLEGNSSRVHYLSK